MGRTLDSCAGRFLRGVFVFPSEPLCGFAPCRSLRGAFVLGHLRLAAFYSVRGSLVFPIESLRGFRLISMRWAFVFGTGPLRGFTSSCSLRVAFGFDL